MDRIKQQYFFEGVCSYSKNTDQRTKRRNVVIYVIRRYWKFKTIMCIIFTFVTGTTFHPELLKSIKTLGSKLLYKCQNLLHKILNAYCYGHMVCIYYFSLCG